MQGCLGEESVSGLELEQEPREYVKTLLRDTQCVTEQGPEPPDWTLKAGFQLTFPSDSL